MNEINLSNNIIRLRHKHKLTQEQLANFIGVTKASVSKWENAQSMPDILLLPQLASFFGVSIDELIGYKPQMSKEQIQCCYAELSKDFVNLPFDKVLEKIRLLAHKYYSCYPLLLQLCVLYWNHFMLAETEEEGKKLLEEAKIWVDHIIENCNDVGVCNEAIILKAGIYLQLKMAREAIELLEPISELNRIQSDMILVQAYKLIGKMEEARNYTQVGQYLSLVNVIGDAILLLSLYEQDIERCEEIIRRIKGIIELYQLEQLHPNLIAQFYYQAAIVYGINKREKELLKTLYSFMLCVDKLIKTKEVVLHGDMYFDLLDNWIARLPLGNMAPRDKKFIQNNIKQALLHPAFQEIKGNKEFQKILYQLLKDDIDKG